MQPEDLAAYQELRVGFTAAVSHELRTPLARLAALLESASLPDAEVEPLLAQAREQVDEMSELVDDVLFLSELESGREVVALAATRALPVLEAVRTRYAENALRADVRLAVAADPPDVTLPLRPRMLRVVAQNLVVNALRYAGPRSSFTLTARLRDDGGVELVAEDDGAGVDEEDLPRLFERFFRSDRARASRGTGLGLAIVKHVVTAAGGEVAATGGPGQGLRVTCAFPAS